MGEPEVKKMTRRTTQRALYTSLLSIVACALMLFGTTFAWFTANTASGVNTLIAANFDVEVSGTSFDTGSHTVTLTRRGGGSAPGYCQFTLTMEGEYLETTTVTYSDGSTQQGEPAVQTLHETQTCRANFSEGVETISFTLNLTSATASITDLSSSWGSYSGEGGMLLRGRAPRPTETEVTDGMTFDFGMDDQEVELPATEEQEAELAAAKAQEAAERESAEKAAAELAAAEANSNEPAETPNGEESPQTPNEAESTQQTAPEQSNENSENEDSEEQNNDADDTDDSGAGDPDHADPDGDGEPESGPEPDPGEPENG